MKKKLFLALAVSIMLICLFAVGVSAAEPDNNGKTVTLSDGTVCALYDTDGNPLIWYITSTDADTGAKTYAHIAANDAAVDRYNGWSGGDQLGSMKITVNGTDYGNSSFVVLNLYDITISRGQRVGNKVTYFSKTFTGASNLEYVFAPLGTTGFGAEDFKNCSNLKYINIEELTELTSVGSQSFNGCPKLFDGQTLDLSNTKLVSTGTNAFATVAFTNVKLPEATFTSLGNQTFCNCKKLETVTGTKNATFGLGNYSFQNCFKLKQLDGLIENGLMIIPEGNTSVGSFAFTECDAIEYIEFPSTFNYVGQQGFSYMSNVKLIDFGKITGTLTLNNCGHFRDMDNLVAVCLPEGMVEINNRAFASCDNLTAFYMPNSIQRLSSNGQQQGSFCNSGKMYFVQERFTVNQCLVNGEVDLSKLVLPSKPAVYYMPESLTTFTGHIYSNDSNSNASIFANCTSLNDVLVFPESFQVMVTMRPFMNMGTEASPKTIVFLGDIEQFVVSHQAKYINYVFANANDEDFDDLGIIRTTGNSNEKGSSAYFCSTGMRYDLAISGRQGSGTDPTTEENIAKINATIAAIHATGVAEDFKLHAPRLDAHEDATCTSPAGNFTYCFCGKEISFVADEGSVALGHNYDNLTDKYYPLVNGVANYYADAMHVYFCEQCNETIEKVEEGTSLFTKYGYSVSESDSKNVSYIVYSNAALINAYAEYKNVVISYGLVVSASADGTPLTYSEGSLVTDANTVKAEMQGTNYNKLTLKVYNLPENQALHCNGYVVVGEVISYLNHATVDAEAAKVTHADMLALQNAETGSEETEPEVAA